MNKEKFFKKIQNNFNIPPFSLEAEQSVLGGLMLNNHKWEIINEIINHKDFFKKLHQIIFIEMGKLIDLSKPIDLITLSDSLKKNKYFNKIEGFNYLIKITQDIPNITNVVYYAEIIKEKSIIRELIKIANEITLAGFHPEGKNSKDLLDFAESKIFKISEEKLNQEHNIQNINSIIKNTKHNIKKLRQNPQSNITGIDTGYIDLNKKTFGLQKSDLIVIAARPSMGKTTFAINICENIAMSHKKPVLIFSLEMPAEQIIIRIISSLSRVDQSKIRTGRLNNQEWIKISSAIKLLEKRKNIFIDDSCTLTPIDIKLRTRKIYKENKGLSLVMIDYLQLMKSSSYLDNRNLEIADISRSLKSLAKELKIPIIALSQLNRSSEQRIDKRPINSDLRESGSIEQDADLILFIYRDEIYNNKSNMKGIAEIIIGKQRNGPTGTIHLIFNGKISRFDNYASRDYNYNNIISSRK